MNKEARNALRSVVVQCRRLLERSVSETLQGRFGIHPTGLIEKPERLTHLTDEDQHLRLEFLAHLEHIEALGNKKMEALEQLVREIAFTHLNRLCAYRMMEVRDVYVGGQRFREAVSKGLKSQGFLFYLADHPEDERRFHAGQQEEAYRHFLNWLGGTLSQEIGVLFSPTDPANRVYPPQRLLDDVLELLNNEELRGIWSEDETIGWVYQYFTPKELRDASRDTKRGGSQAPRNSNELAFRNQFFTPRYVVEFLTDNTLGRIWYEMRRGNTRLEDECRYMVRRPGEVFFADEEDEPGSPVRAMKDMLLGGTEETFPPFRVGETQRLVELAHTVDGFMRHPFQDQVEGEWWPWAKLREIRQAGDLSRFPAQDLLDVLFCQARADRQGGGYGDWEEIFYEIANEIRRRAIEGRKQDACQEQLLRAVTAITQRVKKDPREIKILDPACGSGHFLLYCFALLLVIYEEAYDDPDLGQRLRDDYPTKDDLRRAIPGLILRHNLHGIDIDLRCTQIAALALWLRCQRAYHEMGLKKDRPPILKANVVCAEPMPGEEGLLDEFLKTLREDRLEALIRQVMNVPKDQRVRATRGMVESLSDLVRTVWDKMRLAGEAGSLLKVEDELQDAIRGGQEQWEERLPLFRFTEYGLSEEPKERLVRFVPGDVEGERVTFWDKAETLVRRALDEFVSFASNGGRFQRQLFVEDAEQGLGFVDLCRQRYDAVLMNPPFGDSSKPSRSYIDSNYPKTKNNVYSSFVERGLGLLEDRGFLGAITSRTGFFLTSYQKWREDIILANSQPTAFADLGYGVLDTAKVETAAYCLSKGSGQSDQRQLCAFFKLLASDNKEEGLLQGLRNVGLSSSTQESFYLLAPGELRRVPGSPFAYWVSNRIRRLFTDLPSFESEDRSVRVGLQTSDDFRFVRLWWEVSPEDLLASKHFDSASAFRSLTSSKRWVPFSKGGEYSPFYSDLPLVLNWKNDGEEIKNWVVENASDPTTTHWSRNIRSNSYYFNPGLSYLTRTSLRICSTPLPSGCVFSHVGPAIFVPEGDLYGTLVRLNSFVMEGILSLFHSRGTEGDDQTKKYEVNLIQNLPWASKRSGSAEAVGKKIVAELMRCHTTDELTHVFWSPFVSTEDNKIRAISLMEQIDEIVSQDYEVAVEDALDLAEEGVFTERKAEIEHGLNVCLPVAKGRDQKRNEISYGVGCVVGRWDVRYATGEISVGDLPDPFSPLPACSPGMLRGSDGLPTETSPEDYPIQINRTGILVDDADHPDDIIGRVRDVLEVIWKDRAEAVEKDACEILGVSDLRDYFRKPGAGGFWDDHIKRYSKSRRKAPIYWLLQSSKKNYALWVYYHRLDRDILFKALLNYVEPKCRKEEARLGELRSQKAALGPAAKGAKKLDKDIDRQEAFLSELRDFEDKLRRAANLHLDPDLNDGVVLNIAPLHELVPWKEAKSYWDDLMDGKYEWSSIAKQLREKGLIP